MFRALAPYTLGANMIALTISVTRTIKHASGRNLWCHILRFIVLKDAPRFESRNTRCDNEAIKTTGLL